ncbi:uncharacterized protein LOC114548370 isoform X1 [Perca flavescens]|uniref:uncharacterized protein LOC114548370 isoform X1 n=2 Tax=Perca flavescens TaxID=8167 RepID=UPI00106EF651|nr:uncharacterized protein LOC114548370 isoform X1 [Perca flavescens]
MLSKACLCARPILIYSSKMEGVKLDLENRTAMVIYYPTIEIPMLCAGIVLWFFCCHFAKKRREAEGWPQRPTNTSSVYIIPIYEEDRVEQEDEELMDIYDAYFQPPYRAPPVYCSGNVSPPPPYKLEPPSYPEPPPSYTDPPTYSERP